MELRKKFTYEDSIKIHLKFETAMRHDYKKKRYLIFNKPMRKAFPSISLLNLSMLLHVYCAVRTESSKYISR
jgi:hypothetical protein